jgi:hypothetical protein
MLFEYIARRFIDSEEPSDRTVVNEIQVIFVAENVRGINGSTMKSKRYEQCLI